MKQLLAFLFLTLSSSAAFAQNDPQPGDPQAGDPAAAAPAKGEPAPSPVDGGLKGALKDGRRWVVLERKLLMVGNDGKQNPAPAGDHALRTGGKVRIEEGGFIMVEESKGKFRRAEADDDLEAVMNHDGVKKLKLKKKGLKTKPK